MENFTTKLAWENRVSPYNNFEMKEIRIECIKTSNKFRVHKQYNPVVTKKTKNHLVQNVYNANAS